MRDGAATRALDHELSVYLDAAMKIVMSVDDPVAVGADLALEYRRRLEPAEDGFLDGLVE